MGGVFVVVILLLASRNYFYYKIKQIRGGKMLSWLKFLLHKQGFGVHSSVPTKRPCILACTCIPIAGEADTGGFLELPG